MIRRDRGERRRERVAARIRPLLAQALDDSAGTAAGGLDAALRSLSSATGGALDDLVVSLVPKLRGSGRERLLAVLHVRGTIERSARDVRAGSADRRRAAADFLGAVGGHEHVDALIRLLDDHDRPVRLAAVRALGRIGAAAAIPALFGRLDSPEPGCGLPVHAVMAAVLRCGGNSVGRTVSAGHTVTAVGQPLRRSLRHGGLVSRVAAAQVFGRLGELSAVPELRRALADDEVAVRVAAADALGRLDMPDVPTDLVRCLDLRRRASQPPSVRAAAATALGRFGDTRRVADLAMTVAADGDPVVMLAAAHAMARLGEPGVAALRVLAPVSTCAREVVQLRAAAAPQGWGDVLAGVTS